MDVVRQMESVVIVDITAPDTRMMLLRSNAQVAELESQGW